LEVKRQKKKGINGELKIENYELRIEKMINHKAKQIPAALICHDFINFGVTLIPNESVGLRISIKDNCRKYIELPTETGISYYSHRITCDNHRIETL